MDNFTHTLFGIGLSHALKREAPNQEKPLPNKSWFWASVIGNNIPDSDVLQHFIAGQTSLDYFVHHRGYTHTFLLAAPLALATAFIASKISKEKLDRKLLGISFLAVLMHIAADFMNDYGVHPFSPFLNRWFYGDFIFIVEPFIWFTLLPLALYTLQSRIARAFWSVFGLFALGLVWFGPFAPISVAALHTFVLVVLTFCLFRYRKAWPVGATLVSILLGFSALSTVVENRASALLSQDASISMDRVTTPAPGNPLCWTVWLVNESSESGVRTARRSVVSVFPGFYSPERCLSSRVYPQNSNRTAQLDESDLTSSESVVWIDQYSYKKKDFEDLSEKNCNFKKLLNVARLPFVQKTEEGTIAGDLRYDREPGVGFSETLLDHTDPCPEMSFVWDPPSNFSR